jgi:hypothetical protein
MQAQDFEAFLTEHEALRGTLQRAARAAPAKGFGVAIDMAALVLLFPLVRYLLMEIGLPCLTTLKRYSELQRCRVEDWIDQQAQSHGLDPDAVEAASRQLMEDLERTQAIDTRAQWERLTELLKK